MANRNFKSNEYAQPVTDGKPPRQNNNIFLNQSHPFERARKESHKYRKHITQAAEPEKTSSYVDSGATHDFFQSKSLFMTYAPTTL